MATIDTSCVERELCAIRDTSSAISKLLRKRLEEIEANPGSFPELDDIPKKLRKDYPTATLRKAYIESHRHSFRLIFAHWKLSAQTEHVDFLYAFPRRRGYQIDWKWVDTRLGE